MTVRSGWVRALGLAALGVGLAVFAWWPMLSRYPHTQTYEGPFMQQMLEATRVSVTRYHELPLWNAYQCGGVPLWDNPQGMGVTPLVWPLLWLTDTTRALELWYVLHAAAGFVCMWILARRELGLSREAALVASGMWAFCGTHNLHFTGTGFQWASALFMPLAVFLWRRAERDLRAAVGLAVLMSLEFWGAAVYPIMLTTVVLVGETLTRAVDPRRLRAIARAAAVAGMVAFLLSAGRLIPVVYQGMAHHRSLRTEHDSLQWSTLKDMFLSRTHSRGVTGQEYVWPEFGNYVGPILFGLAVLGVALGAVEHFWLVFALAWAFVFMLGHAGEWAPWHVLKMHVYPFKDMRVPSRFNVPVGMLLSACAGIGVDKVPRVFSRWCTRQSAVSAVRTGVMAFGLVGVGDMIAAGYPAIEDSYVGAPIDEHVKASDHLYLEGPNLAGFVDQPRQNRGRFECWDEWGFERDAPLWKGDVPQAKGKDNDVAASNVTRTQSSFTLDVDARKPGRVLLNTSYDMAWRTSAGKVVDASEQLGVDVPAGKLHLRVWYWPRGLTGGLVLTSLGVAGTLAFFLWDARRRRRSLDTPGAHW